MYNGTLRVLLVEDNPDHATLIERRLAKVYSPSAQVNWVTTFGGAVEALRSSIYDVVLLDLRLPDSNLDETFLRMSAAVPQLPIIALTSLEDFDFAVSLVKQGAQDYIVKSDASPELLSRAIHYAIERKRIQRDLAHYAGELERTNRELDHFTRVVSHDLKSPLAVIQMQANALIKDVGGKDSRHAPSLKSIVETAAQMSTLVDDLLRYARMGTEELEFEQVDCNELLGNLISELKPQIESASAEITFDSLPTIWANRTRLMQVFQNLVTNAIKYHDRRPPRVHVSAEFHGPDWVFSVEDQGVGIPADQQERIFDMFTRLCDDVPGTGVGLAICKRVIESHGGRIWVDSEPGHGATFYFNLFNRPQDVAASAFAASSKKTSTTSSSAVSENADAPTAAASSHLGG